MPATQSEIRVRLAEAGEAEAVTGLLVAVARWLETGGPGELWSPADFSTADVAARIARSEVMVLTVDGVLAACLLVQKEDPDFWPDAEPSSALYLHKLAVDRGFAGRGLSHRLIAWAGEQARASGRGFLRIDCAPRPKLVAIYEAAGFRRVAGSPSMANGWLVERMEKVIGA